ncbi:PREDICTED: uncharacterized protein LOC107346512 isoform X2 [Acropora digitifera]|uniref:uncharacterized protein LOC107346512 isoform X2 n=1 Tax=Acropora digitifera TaxID=70779 RepID=UPI00077AE14D|nr:PREDICTED: uncharacterized protein LOC107346512 isoform X2 [Acropora digitifera]
MVGRVLKVPDAVIDQIEADTVKVSEKCYRVLRRWQEMYPSDATYHRLACALQHPTVDRVDVAVKYCGLQLDGVPGEERQHFPRLGEMRPALPIIVPLPTIRSGQDGAQGESELSTTPDLTSSFTRVPREPLSHEASPGEGSHETDFTDGGPGVTEPLQTSTRVTSLRLQFGLDRDGAFIDPEKYDPIKYLGYGGFAKACLLSTYTLVVVTAVEVAEISVFHYESEKKSTNQKKTPVTFISMSDAPPTMP